MPNPHFQLPAKAPSANPEMRFYFSVKMKAGRSWTADEAPSLGDFAILIFPRLGDQWH